MLTRAQVQIMLPLGYKLVDTTFKPEGIEYPWLGIRKGNVTKLLYPVEMLQTGTRTEFLKQINHIISNW